MLSVLPPLLPPRPMKNDLCFPSRVSLLMLVATIGQSVLSAQTVQTKPANTSAAGGEELIELSPFIVSSTRDTGYTAANTLAGSRLNTSLAVTPASISVFTKDFIEDIGALNVNAAVEYALGASNDVERTGNNVVGNDFNYRIRGFLGASAGRNYFPWSLSSDSFNVERLDFSRGPNSILFGVGGPGGIINTTPKQANTFKAFEAVRFRVASWDDYRGEVDVNQPIGKDAAVRVNLLKQKSGGWRDFERLDRDGVALAASWNLTRTTSIRFDGEWGEVESNKPRPFVANDGYSQWVAAGRPESLTYGASVTGSAALGARISYNPLGGVLQNLPVNLSNFRRSNGATLVGVPNPPQVDDQSINPRRANLMGPGGETNFDYYATGLFINQQIGKNLFLELAGSRQSESRIRHSAMNFNDNRLEVDINRQLPAFNAAGVQTGTVDNPNYGRYFVDGQYRTDDSDSVRNDLRFTAAYELDLGKFGKHSFAVLGSRADSYRESVERREVNVSAARQTIDYNNANNTITRFTYIDLASDNENLRGHQDPRLYPINDQIINGTTFRVQSGMPGRSWSDSLTRIDTAMAAAQSTFWDERIFTTLGARRDRVKNFSSVQTTATDGTNEALGAYRDGIPELDQSGNTFTTGVVGKVTDWVSLYYNRSENFQAQNSVTWSLASSPALSGNVIGAGQDYGLKFSLWDKRINATVGAFKTEEIGRTLSINGLYQVYFESMWNALGQTIDLNGGDTRATKSDGYEVDLTANLTKQWRLAFNFGHIKTKESDLFPTIRSYLAANRATFEAGSSRSVDLVTFPTSRATIGQVLTALDAQIVADTSTENQAPRRHRENTGNLFTNYRFDRGALKGFGLGFGAQYRGGSVIGYTSTGEKVVSDAYTQYNAMISYERKVLSGRAQWKIQLNVDNLLNFTKPQPVDSGFDSAGNLVALRQLVLPARFALTNTLTF